MFRFFEKRLDPFPPEMPTRPPATLIAFCRHYTKGSWSWILATTFLVTLVAITEIFLFSFLGNVIDWLGSADKSTFLEQERSKLMLIGAVVLFALPLLTLAMTLVSH